MADSSIVPVVSVVNLKGGVGKTSVALGIAGAAMNQNMRAIVIDLDPQSHATTALDPQDVHFTTNDVMSGSYTGRLKDALATSAWSEKLRVLASDANLEHRNHPDDGKPFEHRLRLLISKLKGADLVVIDTPPSLSELTKTALTASDLALVVTEPTMFALTATQQTLATVDSIRQHHNLGLRPVGIVVNRFRPRSVEHQFRLDELTSAYRELVVDPVLPDRAVIAQAQGSCVPIQTWPTPGARDAARTFRKYLNRIMTSARSQNSPFGRGASS